MINRKIVFALLLTASIVTAFISGCQKDSPAEPLEPISIIKPDSAIITRFAGDTIPVEIKVTTDRPLNWMKCMYEIDSTDAGGYVPTFPDTLFYVKLDTLDPKVNIYDYAKTYYVPDSLRSYSVVYFKVFFEAGKSSFTVGQNYPAGIVTGNKTFKVNIR